MLYEVITFGHKKIRITAKAKFIPGKKIGRPALLVDYFKPLGVVTEQGPRITSYNVCYTKLLRV